MFKEQKAGQCDWSSVNERGGDKWEEAEARPSSSGLLGRAVEIHQRVEAC